MTALRILAALSLTILPGAWVAFARRGDWLPLTARIGIAGALSPVVVAVEFYLMRLAGVSVQTTAWSLVAINLPAVWIVLQHRPFGRAKSAAIAQWSFVLGLLIAGASVPWHYVDQVRIFYSHTWMHTAIVNQVLSGALWPEEPELAGLRLAYPWLSHVYCATQATLLDWAPTRVYPLTNVIWIVWTAFGIYSIGRALGASGFASRAGVIWLALGTNAMGAALSFLTGRLSGDIRYTPWLRKYTYFNDMPYALGLFACLVALAVLAVRRKDGHHAVLFAAVLAGTGAVYPLIFPPALVIALLVIAFRWRDAARRHSGTTRDVAAYAAASVVGTACTLAVLRVTVVDRVTSGFEPSSLEEVASKIVSATIVLAPFLGAAALMLGGGLYALWRSGGLRNVGESTDAARGLLLLAAVPAVGATTLFHLQGSTYTEYKFIFCAALVLAPFVALAIDRFLSPRLPQAIIVVGSGLLLSPMILMQNPLNSVAAVADAPLAVETGISVHLAAGSAEAGWTNAVREHTPQDTIVVAAQSKVFVPTATGRSLFAPVVGFGFPGYWLESRDNMIGVRGYPRQVVETRLAVVGLLMAATTDAQADEAWTEIRRMDRPVAILAKVPEQDGLIAWLASRHIGQRIFEDGSGRVVWFVDRDGNASTAR